MSNVNFNNITVNHSGKIKKIKINNRMVDIFFDSESVRSNIS